MNRIQILLAVFAASILLQAPSVRAAEAPPHWSSDQIRAARTATSAEAVIFDLRMETVRTKQPPKVEQGTVTLAPDFTHVQFGDSHVLYDHALCRLLIWSGHEALTNLNCHGPVGFRAFELQNRQLLREVLRKSGAPAEDLDPYWDETELGVAVADRLSVKRTGAAAEFRLRGKVVTKASGEAGLLTPDEMRRFGRWLAHQAWLHPQARRDIVGRIALPALIESDLRPGARADRQVLAISNLRRAEATYPLPAGLTSDLRRMTGAVPKEKAIQVVLAALDGRSAPPRPTLRDLKARMLAAARAGRYMEANLLFMNMTQQYGAAFSGPGAQALFAELRPALLPTMQDPEVKRFMSANALAGSSKEPGEREAAARYLAEATDLDGLPFGSFRYVTYANLALNSPDRTSWSAAASAGMPERLSDNYWIHIAAYPWAANAYKDLGDALLSGFDGDAWLAYDLGRAIDVTWRTSVMGQVEALERRIRQQEPDFF